MKKILAISLALILVLAFSVTSFALKSPGGTAYSEVIINRTNTGASSTTAERVTVKDGDSLGIVPGESNNLDFEGWKIYTPDMKAAKEGKDYEIISVKKKDGTPAVKGTDYTVKDGEIYSVNGEYITIDVKPLTDTLYVSEVFKGVKIEFNPPKGTVNSPVTGENNMALVIALGVAMLLSGVMAVVSVKRVRG